MGVIKQLKGRNGTAKHSELLRMNCRKMNAAQFREVISTCQQAGLIEHDTVGKRYLLTPEGWKA